MSNFMKGRGFVRGVTKEEKERSVAKTRARERAALEVQKRGLLRSTERLRRATVAEIVDAIPKEVPVRDPVVLESRFGSLRLCVPGGWSDLQALEFAEDSEPCGAKAGWRVRGERVPCGDGEGFQHLVVGV